MHIVQYGDWKIAVDTEKTKAYYSKYKIKDSQAHRNFAEHCKNLTKEEMAFFDTFGIDPVCCKFMHIGTDKKGNSPCGGYYFVCGEYLEYPPKNLITTEELAKNDSTDGRHLEKINIGLFQFEFQPDDYISSPVHTDKPEGFICIHFWCEEMKWILSEKPEVKMQVKPKFWQIRRIIQEKSNYTIGLKEIMAYEKTQMLPLNFIASYVLTPIYAVICLVLMAAFAILMEIDDEKYLVPGLICLGTLALLSIIFVASVPFVRKKAIKTEFDLYDFDTSEQESLEIYDFSTDEISLKFDKYGMYVNNKLFYYSHLNKNVVTSNHLKRVGIYLQFALDEEHRVTLLLNPVTLKMLECLEIELDNNNILKYIIENKREAIEQIYNKGYVIVPYE